MLPSVCVWHIETTTISDVCDKSGKLLGSCRAVTATDDRWMFWSGKVRKERREYAGQVCFAARAAIPDTGHQLGRLKDPASIYAGPIKICRRWQNGELGFPPLEPNSRCQGQTSTGQEPLRQLQGRQ